MRTATCQCNARCTFMGRRANERNTAMTGKRKPKTVPIDQLTDEELRQIIADEQTKATALMVHALELEHYLKSRRNRGTVEPDCLSVRQWYYAGNDITGIREGDAQSFCPAESAYAHYMAWCIFRRRLPLDGEMFTRVMTTPVRKGGIGKLVDMVESKVGFKGFTIGEPDQGRLKIDNAGSNRPCGRQP